jgi:hypothetical protein
VSLLLGLISAACASHPAAPFDTLKNGNVTLLRLQNYEQTAQAAPGVLPGIPQQIQQWAQQAAPALQQLLPPGLLPPELLQGPVLPTQNAGQFRFHGRLVLGTAQVLDPELREELADLFGDEDNFQSEHQPCSYAELGLGWTSQPGLPPYEMLISFSCNQVQAAQGFAWPHDSGIGMKAKTVSGLTRVVQQLFPTTTARPLAYVPLTNRRF